MAIWDDLWNSSAFNTAAGVATGGLWTVGRTAADLAFNGGKGTSGFFQDPWAGMGGKEIERAAGAAGDYLGLNPQQVPAVDINAAAGQMPGYDDWRNKLAHGAQQSAERAGPSIDTGPQSQIRGQQGELTQMLMDQAQGRGPSVANDQLRQGTERNMAQAMSLGASLRGQARGGQLRGIADQQAGISQQMASDAAVLRLQEQMAARNALSGHLGNMRGQDIGLATDQARVALQQSQMNDDLVKFYTSQGLGLDAAQRAANMEMEKMRVQEGQDRRGLMFGAEREARGNRMGVVNTVGSMGMKAATGGLG